MAAFLTVVDPLQLAAGIFKQTMMTWQISLWSLRSTAARQNIAYSLLQGFSK
jgi:hypothetical protein